MKGSLLLIPSVNNLYLCLQGNVILVSMVGISLLYDVIGSSVTLGNHITLVSYQLVVVSKVYSSMGINVLSTVTKRTRIST
jgi:hypothetical protein